MTLPFGGVLVRASPRYELIPLERLEDTAVQSARLAPKSYGILRARHDAKDSRVVDESTALVFLTLATPGPLPAFAREALLARRGERLARLFMDAILEAFIDEKWQTGATVAKALLGTEPGERDGISARAIRHVIALELTDIEDIAARLYAYNAKPMTAAIRARLATPEAVRKYLCVDEGQTGGALRRSWREVLDSRASGAWIYFQSARGELTGDVTYKLYVNLAVRDLAERLPGIVATLESIGAPSFKIGRTLPNLLRSDKLVVYFTREDELTRAVDELTVITKGAAPHATPFTAVASDDGTLSWGLDPRDPGKGFFREAPRASWRAWVTQRVAQAIVRAKENEASGDILDDVLSRVAAEGFDTKTWAPTQRQLV